MKCRYYVVDAFTDHLFGGGPAGVLFMDKWLPDATMQNVAMENQLADTAFLVPKGNDYDVRWFMPNGEISLNGHASLAAAYVIFRDLEPERDSLIFHSPSGDLTVTREDDYIVLNMPQILVHPVDLTMEMVEALGGARPKEAYLGENYLFVFENEEQIKAVHPDFSKMANLEGVQGCFITAEGTESDIVGRTFWPKMGINEDPVCGNMHCNLTPFWTRRLGKTEIVSHQLSRRGAVVRCEQVGDRVLLKGQAVVFLQAVLKL